MPKLKKVEKEILKQLQYEPMTRKKIELSINISRQKAVVILKRLIKRNYIVKVKDIYYITLYGMEAIE